MCAQAGPAGRVQVGVPVDDQQAQPAQIVQDGAQRRELAPVELARPVGRYPGYQGGTFGEHMREGGIGGQHGCRPGPAGAQVLHVHGGAQAAFRVCRCSYREDARIRASNDSGSGPPPAPVRSEGFRKSLNVIVRVESARAYPPISQVHFEVSPM
jgi:hypothetical protein